MTKRSALLAIAIFLAGTVLVACGGGGKSASNSAGDPKRGKELYSQTVVGSYAAPCCATCQ